MVTNGLQIMDQPAEAGHSISLLKSAHLLVTLLQVLICPYCQKLSIFVQEIVWVSLKDMKHILF